MVLRTTYDMYMSFLDGIKKYGTGAVDHFAFNRIINEWGQDEWLKTNISKGVELTQDLQDRLSILKITTDGVYVFSQRVDGNDRKVVPAIPCNSNITTLITSKNITLSGNNIIPNVDNYFPYPLNGDIIINDKTYPEYMRLLGVQFKIEYINNKCKEGISDWLSANINRTDNKSINNKNPFRKAKDNRLYYEIINDYFVLKTGTESKGHSMKIDYLRYPRNIFFNVNNGGNVTLEQTGIPDYSGGVLGSVNCELPGTLRKEIVDTAVRVFIERIQDPRYKSYLNELNIKHNG